MDYAAIETAIFLLKTTDDLLYKDAIRVLSTPDSPPNKRAVGSEFRRKRVALILDPVSELW